jgi:serine/threonine-protein kinase
MFPHEPLPEHIGPYKILRHLSSRGAADLYLGEHVGPMGFQRTCVLKLVPAPGPDDVRSAQELAHEAKICSRLNHPAIVRMHDFFEHGDRLVLVFEHFAGLSLARLLAHLRRRRMEMSDAITWFIAHQLFSALAHAHALNDEEGRHTPVVHRDVQPAHIIISNDAQVRLTGYGIAKIAGTVGDTAVGFIKGTPAYMAPEQARGEGVTERVDIYAAGLVVWEMLTGQSAIPPGQARPGADLLRLISGRRVDAVMALRSDIPREIGAALDACLEPAVEKRTIKCADVERWLKKVCDVNSGREQLRERLVQMRNVEMRPVPGTGAARMSLPPKAPDSVHAPPRFPGVATRVTGRVSAAAPGVSQAPPVSRRGPSLRGTRSFAPPAMAHAAQADAASEQGSNPADAKARRGTLVGIAPPPAELAEALKAVAASEAQEPKPMSVRAAARGRAAERSPLQSRHPIIGRSVPSPWREPPPDSEPPQAGPAADAPPKVVVAAEPPVAAAAVGKVPLHAAAPAETTSVSGRRRTRRVLTGAAIAVGAIVAASVGAFGISRMTSAAGPEAAASASAMPLAVESARAPMTAEPALPVPAAVESAMPAATASAAPAAADTAAPEATVPVAPAPLSAVASAVDVSKIPQGMGALVVKSPPEGVVYTNGIAVGETDQAAMAPCGRRFVRVGTKLGPAGLKAVSWLSEGQSVDVPCRQVLEISAVPAVPIRAKEKKTPKDPPRDPTLPWSIAPF